jgi:PBP1b-binding outer membrane lipoprotein LpoB
MDFEWSDVTAVSYAHSDDEDSKALYEIQIKRQKKNSTTSSELQLYTTDEAVVKNLVAQLNKLRQGCSR